MRKHMPASGQLAFDLTRDAELERIIEARVSIRAQNEAVRWRLRLILIETATLASLVAAAGAALGHPAAMIARTALLVGAGCLFSGLGLVGLSAVTGRLLGRLGRGAQR